MKMSLHQQRNIIDAAINGEEIEFCFMGDLDASLWCRHNAPMFDFTRYNYRVKPPALRPHWPALVRSIIMQHTVTSALFASDAEASHILGFVRLATEYPPVMLP